jgi:alkaline phosphatase D
MIAIVALGGCADGSIPTLSSQPQAPPTGSGYRLPTNPPIAQTTTIPVPPPPTFAPAPEGAFRIALTSCFLNPRGGFALATVARAKPDLQIWLGDNIYADTEDMTVLRDTYDLLGANPRFKALAGIPATMAVWDDHDYGWDNANRTWPYRDASKDEFLRFWHAAPDDPRWTQPGVYSARTFGSGDRTVQVILLDNRYNLDPYDYDGTDPNRTILGDVQWAWLKDRLAEPATIRIIGSGIQVVQDYDIDDSWESWGDSPLERERLFALIRDMGIPGVVFVSGDMHFAELTRHPDDPLGYPTYDLTASGLDRNETEAEGQWINPNRVGELLNDRAKFGLIEIDWDLPDPEIHLQIHDAWQVHLDRVVKLSELQPD